MVKDIPACALTCCFDPLNCERKSPGKSDFLPLKTRVEKHGEQKRARSDEHQTSFILRLTEPQEILDCSETFSEVHPGWLDWEADARIWFQFT